MNMTNLFRQLVANGKAALNFQSCPQYWWVKSTDVPPMKPDVCQTDKSA